MIHPKKISRFFTLVELVVAMSIFAVLMLILMQIFSATQDVWRKTGSKADTYESVRIALNMIEADFAAATYHQPINSFYYNSDTLWFPSRKGYKLNSSAKTREVEACYFLENSYAAGSKQLKNLYVNYTSDNESGWDIFTAPAPQNTPNISGMANTKKLLLENVCSLVIRPLTKNFTPIPNNSLRNLPTIIEIELSVIDDDEAIKKKYAAADNVKRTFRRFIFIDQGQEL